MRALRFVLDYWWVPLLVVVAVVASILWIRFNKDKPLPIERVAKKIKGVQARREARDIAIEKGAEEAKKQVKLKYKATIQRLDREKSGKVAEIESMDPESMAKMLEELTR